MIERAASRNYIAELERARDPQEIIDLFLSGMHEALTQKPILFLKFLPAHRSLVVTQAAGIPLEKVRGIGVNLQEEALITNLQRPQSLVGLRKFMKQAFQLDQFHCVPLICGECFQGVVVSFVAWPDSVSWFWRLFKVHYHNQILQKQCYDSVITDPETGLLHARAFDHHLFNELKRARRILLPVSLICLRVDDWNGADEIERSLHVKHVSQLLRRTSRNTDLIGHFGGGYFGVILPHTRAQGASIKAERFRRWIEMKGQCTISAGISEYPSLSEDTESLLRAAREALDVVSDLGANKVALASSPPGFTPDFKL